NQSVGPVIAVTPSGEVSVAGTTQSTDFPVTADAWHPYHAGGVTDVFVSKFDASGALRYSTYLGGARQELARTMGVGSAGVIVVAGDAESTDLATPPGVQPAYAGSVDAFLVKISPEPAPPDPIPPTTTIAVSGTPGIPGWYKSSVTVSLSAVDNVG